jgi:hypothetical protein
MDVPFPSGAPNSQFSGDLTLPVDLPKGRVMYDGNEQIVANPFTNAGDLLMGKNTQFATRGVAPMYYGVGGSILDGVAQARSAGLSERNHNLSGLQACQRTIVGDRRGGF